MFRPEQFAGYDRSTILFSPDGRIIQVEYARKAMQRGTPSIGVLAKDGVLLFGKRKLHVLILPTKKVFKIDNHVGAVFSGYSSDGRYLVDFAREKAQTHKFLYDEPIDISYLGLQVADHMHTFTQYGGARPFGCGIIFGGIDLSGPQLLYVDPGGSMMNWIAGAIGQNKEIAERYFKSLAKNGKLEFKFEDALLHGLTALFLAAGLDIKPIEIEVGYIREGEEFVIKTGEDEEIATYLDKAKELAKEWKKKSEELGEEEEGSEEF